MTTPSLRPYRTSSRHRQRGAAAVFAAISLIAMLTMMALAIDVGRLYFAQRDLQRLANIAALDSVRVASGCATDGHPGSLSEVSAEVQASLARNQDAGSLATITAVTQVGRKTVSQGLREFEVLDESNVLRDAVQVTLSRQTPARIFPLIANGAAQTLTALSVADQPAIGSFHVGTTVASLNGGAINNLLGPLLCQVNDAACQSGVIALNVGSAATGLASVSVSPSQLATALGVNVEDLSDPVALAAQAPLVGDVLSGLAGSLSGTANATIVGLLQQLGNLATNPSTIPLADLLGNLNNVAPDAPLIDLFDLVMALAQAANVDESGVTAVRLPVTVNVPGVATAYVFLKLLEPPTLGTGPAGSEQATARNSQVRLEVRLQTDTVINTTLTTSVAAINAALGLIGGHASATVPVRIGIDLEAALATASLDSLQCPAAGINNGMPIAGLSVETDVAAVAIGTFSGNASGAPVLTAGSSVPLVSISGLGSNLNLALGLSAGLGGSSAGSVALQPITAFEKKSATTQGQADFYQADGGTDSGVTATANPQTVQSGTSLSLGVRLLTTGSSPGLVTALVNTLLSTINVLVAQLTGILSGLTTTLGNLLAGLGVGLGGATVTMEAVTVAQPELITLQQ